MDAKHILNNGREVENIMAFHVIHYWVSLLDGKTAKRAPAFSSILFHTCHNSSINSLKRSFPLADPWLRMLPTTPPAPPAEQNQLHVTVHLRPLIHRTVKLLT